mmetsp:Transcript_86706/g.269502  ORF Transcript_86706/g.269502 Transcript_86706/m.269502 type:complete len:228 (-) Transcript_86706:169-852(-)
MGATAASLPRTWMTSFACKPSFSHAPSTDAPTHLSWTRRAASSSAWANQSVLGTTRPQACWVVRRAPWPHASGTACPASGPSSRTGAAATAVGSSPMSTESLACWSTSALTNVTWMAWNMRASFRPAKGWRTSTGSTWRRGISPSRTLSGSACRLCTEILWTTVVMMATRTPFTQATLYSCWRTQGTSSTSRAKPCRLGGTTRAYGRHSSWKSRAAAAQSARATQSS